MVAHSIPKKAYSVKVATAEIAEKLLSPVKLNAGKLSNSKKKSPTIITNRSGNILNMVVTS